MSDRIPNTFKVGDTVYFVAIPWGAQTPVIHTRVVTQSSQKQMRLDGYGPKASNVFWIAVDGSPRHGDYHRGDEPCFYATKAGALRAYERLQRAAAETWRKAADECEQAATWAATMLVTP